MNEKNKNIKKPRFLLYESIDVISILLALLLVLLIFTLSDTARARIQNQASQSDESEFSVSIATSFLTGPNDGDPLDIAMSYILDNRAAWGLSEEDLSDIIVTDLYRSDHTGTTHIYLRQRYHRREIHGANININIAADGSVINAGSSFVGNLADSVQSGLPEITAQEAVQVSAESAGLASSEPLNVESYLTGDSTGVVFDGAGFSLEPIPAKLVYVVTEENVQLAWITEIYELNAQHFWSTYVDAQHG